MLEMYFERYVELSKMENQFFISSEICLLNNHNWCGNRIGQFVELSRDCNE